MMDMVEKFVNKPREIRSAFAVQVNQSSNMQTSATSKSMDMENEGNSRSNTNQHMMGEVQQMTKMQREEEVDAKPMDCK